MAKPFLRKFSASGSALRYPERRDKFFPSRVLTGSLRIRILHFCFDSQSSVRLSGGSTGKWTSVNLKQPPFVAPTSVHHPEFVLYAAASRAKQNFFPVRRPGRVIAVPVTTVFGQLLTPRLIRIDDPDLTVTVFYPRPECNLICPPATRMVRSHHTQFQAPLCRRLSLRGY